jgi:hypothetical protein
MPQVAPDCVDFDTWYDTLPNDEQTEVLALLRAMARQDGVTIVCTHLVADEQSLVAQDAFVGQARITTKFSLN